MNNKRNRNNYYSDDEDRIPKDPIEIHTDNESSYQQINNNKPVRDNSNIIKRIKQDSNINRTNPNTHPSKNISSYSNNPHNQNHNQTNQRSPSPQNRLPNSNISNNRPLNNNDLQSENYNTNSYRSNNSNFNVSEMRNKIKEQANRLQSLESYKFLCERKIRQLIPNQIFPLKEEDVLKSKNASNLKFDENAYFTLLEKKEDEISILKTELEKLQNLNKNILQNNSNQILNMKNNNISGGYNQNNNFNQNALQGIDKIPNDQLRDNYQKLHKQYLEIQMDREQILESLRVETLNNEEQRNYIEILKKTIESNIVKHGLNPIIQQQRQNYYTQRSPNNGNFNYTASNLEVLIDICKFQNETEKAKKDLLMSQILITELKQEIEFLHKTNEELNIKKDRIKENLENNIFELEDNKEKLRNLEAEKEEINQCYSDLLKNSEKIQEELQYSNEVLGKYEKELHESAKKINDLGTENENNTIIQNKMLEYKKSFEKIYDDFESNLKIKNKLESELIELKEDLELKRMEINRLKILNEEKESKFEGEKKLIVTDLENLTSRHKKLERNFTDIENLLKEREREVLKYQDKFNDCEQSIKEKTRNFDNLDLDFLDYKKSSERKIDALEKNIRELMSSNSIMKANIDNLSNEKNNLLSEIESLNNNNDILNNNLLDFESQNELKDKNLLKINEEYEKLFKDYTELESERKLMKNERDNLIRDNRQIKEFYEKELSDKNIEINRHTGEINFLKNEVFDNKEKNCEANEKIQFSNNQITDMTSKIMKLEFEIKTLLEKEEELKRKTEQLNILSRKHENLNKDKDDLIIEIDTINHKLNDSLKKNTILESEIQERENEKNNLLTDIRKYEKDLKIQREENENYILKLDKIHNDYQRENKICSDLTNQNKNISLKAEELANALEFTIEDKDHLQKEAKILMDEIQNLKKSEKDLGQKYTCLKNDLTEIKNINYSTHAIFKTFVLKFYSFIKDNNKKNLFSNKFSENILEFFEYVNNFNNQIQLKNQYESYNISQKENLSEKNFISTINFIEKCARSVCSEMELCSEKLKEISEENQENFTKLKSLEKSYHNLSLNSEDRIANERKLNQNLFEIKEENKNLIDDIRNLESQCEKLVSDYKNVRLDLKKKIEENGDLKNEIREINTSNSKISLQIKEKNADNNYLNYQILALEDCIKIITREKKNLESLINKISKCLPVKEMQKSINEVLCIFDSLGQMERDRSKLEQNLKNLEGRISNSGNNCENISVQLKIERDNLKNEIEEINKKISEKKDEQRKYELELRAIDLNEKRSDIKYDHINTKSNYNNYNNYNHSYERYEDDKINHQIVTNPNKSSRNYEINNINNTNNDFSRTYDSNINDPEFTQNRTSNINNIINNPGKFENRTDSYPSQDIPRNDYNINYNVPSNDYYYVGSSGYEESNKNQFNNTNLSNTIQNTNPNSNSILRKYKRVGSYFD